MKRREWLKRWPFHCRTCEGHTDSANPCQACIGHDFSCPRCGLRTTVDGADAIDREDATIPCRVCGWVEGADMGCPPSRAMLRTRARLEREDAERRRTNEIRALRARLAELEGVP